MALLRAGDRARAISARTVEPYGITRQQYNVLRILRGAEPEGLLTLTVAERMIERDPGITRMIDRLEKKGLVLRERGTTDRRCVYCRISPKGLVLLSKLDAPIDRANQEIFAPLHPEERRQLVRLLDRIRAD